MKYYEQIWLTEDGVVFKDEEEARDHERHLKAQENLLEFVSNLNKLGFVEWDKITLFAKAIANERKELIYLLQELD